MQNGTGQGGHAGTWCNSASENWGQRKVLERARAKRRVPLQRPHGGQLSPEGTAVSSRASRTGPSESCAHQEHRRTAGEPAHAGRHPAACHWHARCPLQGRDLEGEGLWRVLGKEDGETKCLPGGHGQCPMLTLGVGDRIN